LSEHEVKSSNCKLEVGINRQASDTLCKARDAREMLGCSNETLRVLRDLHPELAVDLTGHGRFWYRTGELIKLKDNNIRNTKDETEHQ
jgi:hypothetical protein